MLGCVRPRMIDAVPKGSSTGPQSCGLDPFDLRQPGRRTLRVVRCLAPIWTNGGNALAAATFERCPQLLLTDGMRTSIRSDVAETEHVQVPATTSHGRQTRHVASPLIAIERVEQPAIEHPPLRCDTGATSAPAHAASGSGAESFTDAARSSRHTPHPSQLRPEPT